VTGAGDETFASRRGGKDAVTSRRPARRQRLRRRHTVKKRLVTVLDLNAGELLAGLSSVGTLASRIFIETLHATKMKTRKGLISGLRRSSQDIQVFQQPDYAGHKHTVHRPSAYWRRPALSRQAKISRRTTGWRLQVWRSPSVPISATGFGEVPAAVLATSISDVLMGG